MGICLDTAATPVPDASSSPQMRSYPTGRLTNHQHPRTARRHRGALFSPPGPLVFVLGGPGTGKVTFSDRLVKLSQGKLFHIPMEKVLGDYASHFKLDGGVTRVSSIIAVDMLTSRLRAVQKDQLCLVSGFPRHLDDFTELMRKMTSMDGAVMLDYPLEVMTDLIRSETQKGHISAAQGESDLNRYVSQTLPLAEFLSSKKLLHKISLSGRSMQDNLLQLRQVVDKIVETRATSAPVPNSDSDTERLLAPAAEGYIVPGNEATSSSNRPKPIIFVMGGPGSDKSRYSEAAAPHFPDWTHLSCSWLLRDMTSHQLHSAAAHVPAVRQLLESGQLVYQEVLLQCLEKAMAKNSESKGYIISGYPRNKQQLDELQQQQCSQPTHVILIDCSELELGRSLGRREDLDDSVAACRARLQNYRDQTLPFMKTLDREGRLLVIDGDRDEDQIMDDLRRCIYLEILRLLGHSPLSATTRNHQSVHWSDSTALCKDSGTNHKIVLGEVESMPPLTDRVNDEAAEPSEESTDDQEGWPDLSALEERREINRELPPPQQQQEEESGPSLNRGSSDSLHNMLDQIQVEALRRSGHQLTEQSQKVAPLDR